MMWLNLTFDERMQIAHNKIVDAISTMTPGSVLDNIYNAIISAGNLCISLIAIFFVFVTVFNRDIGN